MITCPVCSKEMKETETSNLFTCERTRHKIWDNDVEVESDHCQIMLNSQGQQILKVIEVLPYIFHIHDNPKSLRQTRISQIVQGYKQSEKHYYATFGDDKYLCEDLILVPGTVNIQWNDPEAVKERVKMYMLFS